MDSQQTDTIEEEKVGWLKDRKIESLKMKHFI